MTPKGHSGHPRQVLKGRRCDFTFCIRSSRRRRDLCSSHEPPPRLEDEANLSETLFFYYFFVFLYTLLARGACSARTSYI